MFSKRLVMLAAGALMIAWIVGGCGGGETKTTTINKAEFVKAANAICAKTQDESESRFNAYVEELNGKYPEQPAAVAATQRKVAETILVPIKRQEAEELRALGVPAGDEKKVNAIVDAVEKGIRKAETHPEEAVNESVTAFGESEKLADEYGLDGC